MANWKYILDFGGFYHDDSISISKKANFAAKKILKLCPRIKEPNARLDLSFLANDFADLTLDTKAEADEFDNVMVNLYDWADQEIAPFGEWPKNKMCWVETSSRPQQLSRQPKN